MLDNFKALAAVIAVSAATLLGSVNTANAADFGEVKPKGPISNVAFVQLGTCHIEGYSGTNGAALYLSTTAAHWDGQFAGGKAQSWGTLNTRTPISVSRIATCLQTSTTNIASLLQDGPSVPWVNDPYLGFSFTLLSDTPNASAGTYEFAFSDTPANQAPVANAGADQTVASATAPVTLDGTASSDPESQALTYAWAAPAGVTLSDATAASPTFTAPTLATGDADLTLTFELIVTDSLGLASTADTVTITVTAPANQAPVANAGPDQIVASATAPVTLNGTASSDPESQALTYAWTAPAGVTISDATAASPTFTAPTLAAGDADQTLTFELIVTDSLGLASTADTVTITVVSGPTVTLSGGPEAITNTDPFTVTATFSKDVTGFDQLASDVIVTNGSVTGISGGPAIYTLTITPTGNGDVSITVPVVAAQDNVGNGNSASNTLMIGNQIVEITQEQIAGFMLTRANNLASNQPGLTRFLMGEGCGNFNLSATNGSGSVSGCVTRGNTWAEITSAWSGDGSYTLGTLGAHASLNPNLLVGGMVQFDYADDPANNASGKGYMVGPYFVAKLPEQPLYFEGRLLYGQTDNEISPLGTYTDSFETERWLAQLRATGEYKLRNTTLMPLLDVTYTEDNQRAYTDSLGNTIPSQAVDLMQVSAGLDFSTPIPVQMGNLELTGGIKGIYSSTNGGTAAPEFENWRGRTTLGLNYDTGRGGTLKFGSFYDGLGTNYESYGASLNFDMKF